jgi:hypothetical protein
MKTRSRMKTYVIHWKCTATGRIGTGTIFFEKEEAERLAAELNGKHPEIDHEAVIPARAPSAEPAGAHPPQARSG